MRSITDRSLAIRLAVIAAVFTGAHRLHAALITNPQSFGAPPAVLTGDLLETDLLSFSSTGNFVHEGGGGPAELFDGDFTPAQAGVTTPDTNAFVVFTFDTSVNTLGYTLTEVIMSGGWADDGRDRQDWTLSYTVVGDPTLIPITTISFEPTGIYSSYGITDSSGILATNVETLRLDFPNQENTYAGYGEFDVLGVAVVPPVPEPATVTMLGLGLLGWRLVRRRRRPATVDRTRRR